MRAHYLYEYDARDNRTGVDLLHLGAHVGYSYDRQDRLRTEAWTGVNLAGAGAAPCSNLYAAVAGGNESAKSDAVCATPGGSGAMLAAPYTGEYQYDRAGNRVSKLVDGVVTLYQYDARNRLTQEQPQGQGAIAYGYDANGNQTTRTQGAKAESLGFDYANRIHSYVRTGAGGTEANTLYRYMPSGERLAKIDALAAPMATEWYAYDGADVVTDYAQSGAGPLVPKAAYLQSLSIDSKLARLNLNPNGTVADVNWFVPDALGSVHQILGNDGATLGMELTTAWGEKLPGSVFAFANQTGSRYGYTQREADSESGLLHFRARSYDPRTGRFVSKDPVLSGRTRPYLYGYNNPTKFIDPTGRQGQDPEELAGSLEKKEKAIREELWTLEKRYGTPYPGVPRAAEITKELPGLLYQARVAREFAPLKSHAYGWFGAGEYLNRLLDAIRKSDIEEYGAARGTSAQFNWTWNTIYLEDTVRGQDLNSLIHEATHAVHDYYSGNKDFSKAEGERLETFAARVIWGEGGYSVLERLVQMESIVEKIVDPASDKGKEQMNSAKVSWRRAKDEMESLYKPTPYGNMTLQERIWAREYFGIEGSAAEPGILRQRYSQLKDKWTEATKE